MNDKMDQNTAGTDVPEIVAETTNNPAGEMMISVRRKAGARALALSGFALGIGMAVMALDLSIDTTVSL
jgi:hypothetical protein